MTTSNMTPKHFFDPTLELDSIARPEKMPSSNPTTEEDEERKQAFAGTVSKDLIQGFTHEDRQEIIFAIKEQLESNLRQSMKAKAVELLEELILFERRKCIIF